MRRNKINLFGVFLPRMSLSALVNKFFNVGKAIFTVSKGGAGFLLRQRFDIVQTIFRANDT